MKSNNEIRALPGLIVIDTAPDGGMGELWWGGKRFGSVIWSNGGGWDHVSVAPYKRSHTPTWQEMCRLKDMFFYDYEIAVQYHPAKSDYVNNVPNCLHLWRPNTATLPTPPSIMVGIRNGQSVSEIMSEINSVTKKERDSDA